MRRFSVLLVAVVAAGQVFAQKIPLIDSGEVLKRAAVLADSGKHELAIKELLTIPSRDTNYIPSQVRLAEYYSYAEKFDEAEKIAERMLKGPTEYRSQMLRLKARGYERKKDFDKALSILQDVLKENPFDAAVRYQIATTYHNKHDYDNAIKAYCELLDISPFSHNAHLNLGNIAMWTGQKTHAMLSWGVYLCLKTDDNAKLIALENLAGNQLAEEGTSEIKPGPNAFERLDQILRSRIAMDKKFKTEVDVNASLVRQYEMIFQQLNTVTTDVDDPWVKYYLPIYTKIRDQKMIAPFLYHVMTSSLIADVKKWNSRNEKTRQAFFTTINSELSKNRSTVKLPASFGMGATASADYSDRNEFKGFGGMVNGKKHGKWIYFHSNAQKSAEGVYEADVKKGVWTYYLRNGLVNTVENEDTGEITGYHENGSKRVHYFVKDQKIEGEIQFFYLCGNLSEKRLHKNGMRQGKGQVFYKTGVLKTDFEYADNKLTGKWIDYDPYGKVSSTTDYKEGERDGISQSYWPNGKKKDLTAYKAGKLEGPTEGYYDNGKLRYKGTNANDQAEGESTYYDRNGALSEKRFYSAGEYDKEYSSYRHGVLYEKFKYEKGKLLEMIYYAPDGREIGKSGHPSGTFHAKQYYPTGQLFWEGDYKDGNRQGKWMVYYINGITKSIYNYDRGRLDGEQIDNHFDGKRKMISNYKAGLREGYIQEFHSTGKLEREGWYSEDERQQQMFIYHSNGEISEDNYYLNGSLIDSAFVYSVEGKITTKNFYSLHGTRLNEITYDAKSSIYEANQTRSGDISLKYSDGTVRARYKLVCGDEEGVLERFYPDGTLMQSHMAVDGERNGASKYFAPDGSPAFSGFYVNGYRAGVWTYYNELGKLDQVSRYVNGEIDSTLTNYYEHGAVYNTVEYFEDKRNGISRFFAPDGTLVVEKNYFDGDLVGVRATGKNGQFGEWSSSPKDYTITAYYANGIKAYEEHYANGVIHGTKRVFYPDGKICLELNYVEGDYSGPFLNYYPNGKLCSKGQNLFDEKDGLMEVFNEDGTPKAALNYKLGRLSGSVVFYTKTGKKELTYFDGLPIK